MRVLFDFFINIARWAWEPGKKVANVGRVSCKKLVIYNFLLNIELKASPTFVLGKIKLKKLLIFRESKLIRTKCMDT